MGFKEARARLIEALESGHYDSEERSDPEQKNLLDSGVVRPDFVVRLLHRCAGWEYSSSKPTHVIRTVTSSRRCWEVNGGT